MARHILGGTGAGAYNQKQGSYGSIGASGETNGGAGGYAMLLLGGYTKASAGGGTGNPGGNGANGKSGFHLANYYGNDIKYKGNDGTGGLLVIYCNKYNNEGKIEANGVESRAVGEVSGGASGGGSINIFYNEFVQNNSCIANGGAGANYGGSGGAGSVTIGNVSTGTFERK